MCSVRYNYTIKSKMFYCPLILFSVRDVQLIWQQSQHHLSQLHQFNFHIQFWFVLSPSSGPLKLSLFLPWHSVHWVSALLKTTNPSFLPSPLIDVKTVQAPLFLGNSSLYIGFLWISPENQIFQWTPLVLKFFILNPIPSFKSN